MKTNFKAIVSDIDLTITRRDHTTSQRNIDAIINARKAGYLFGLASGRPLEDIINKHLDWNIQEQFDFIIAWNGCQLYDKKTNKEYHYNYLQPNELKEIIEFMSQFNCSVNIYKPNIYMTDRESNRAWYSAFRNKRTLYVEEDIQKYYDEESGGIMFRTTEEDMPLIEKQIQEHINSKNLSYFGFKTQPDLMEFANINCNKGTGLQKYCELTGIKIDEIIGFGDTSNDNEMLAMCYGVAMINGSEDTKACAKTLTHLDVDEDGFADYIEKHLL